jgi:hypothetical protein
MTMNIEKKKIILIRLLLKYNIIYLKKFLTIYRLYEVVSKFKGSLEPDQQKRKVYAKKQFIDIMKQIKGKQSNAN